MRGAQMQKRVPVECTSTARQPHWPAMGVGRDLALQSRMANPLKMLSAFLGSRERAPRAPAPSDDRQSRIVDEVDEAVDESFPASDPPSHTPTGGAKLRRSRA